MNKKFLLIALSLACSMANAQWNRTPWSSSSGIMPGDTNYIHKSGVFTTGAILAGKSVDSATATNFTASGDTLRTTSGNYFFSNTSGNVDGTVTTGRFIVRQSRASLATDTVLKVIGRSKAGLNILQSWGMMDTSGANYRQKAVVDSQGNFSLTSTSTNGYGLKANYIDLYSNSSLYIGYNQNTAISYAPAIIMNPYVRRVTGTGITDGINITPTLACTSSTATYPSRGLAIRPTISVATHAIGGDFVSLDVTSSTYNMNGKNWSGLRVGCPKPRYTSVSNGTFKLASFGTYDTTGISNYVEKLAIDTLGSIIGNGSGGYSKFRITPEGGYAVWMTSVASIPANCLVSPATDSTCIITPVSGDGAIMPFGVTYTGGVSSSGGWVVVSGRAQIRFDSAAVNRFGSPVAITSTTLAGHAHNLGSDPGGTNHDREIGHPISGIVSSADSSAYVNVHWR